MSFLQSHLSRRSSRPGPSLSVGSQGPEVQLACGRVHEACGRARHTLALWLAGRAEGPVLWIAPAWEPVQLNCDGMRDWIDPARIVFVHPRRSEDLLWTMEETLRAGAVAFAVADLPALPGLTQVRRMHLAAETGTRDGPHPPTGLLLTPGEGGAAGVETRWHMAPDHAGGAQIWRLERRRARTAPAKRWEVRAEGDPAGARLNFA